MAAISYVFTIRRAAQILGRDEELLWDLSEQLEPEDGKLWVLDIEGAETLAFSQFDIENLREIITQVNRQRRPWASSPFLGTPLPQVANLRSILPAIK